MANAFGDFNKMPDPVKQPPVGGGTRQQGGNTLGSAGQSFQPPQLDEFGRNPGALGVKNPLAAVGDFNQRKANAMSMMPGPQGPAAMAGTGGGFMAPGPPQQADPPAGAFTRQQPMPYSPQGGFGAGAGAGMFDGGRMPPVGQESPQQQMQPPPGFQQMMQNPGFMQWLMKMFAQQQGGGQQPTPGGLPPQQAGPMTQGPPR
jgi:hypothetical protein